MAHDALTKHKSALFKNLTVDTYDYRTCKKIKKKREEMISRPKLLDVRNVIELLQGFVIPIYISKILSFTTLAQLTTYRETEVHKYHKKLIREDNWTDEKHLYKSNNGLTITLIPQRITDDSIEDIIKYIPESYMYLGNKRIADNRRTQLKNKSVPCDYSQLSYNTLVRILGAYIETSYIDNLTKEIDEI
jgi:hypothetical protein